MAHLAEEETLIAAFNQVGPSGSNGGGIDPFTVLAEEMDQNRADIKNLFYAVSYGMGAETLSKRLSCDVNTAKRWKTELLSKFPKVRTCKFRCACLESSVSEYVVICDYCEAL